MALSVALSAADSVIWLGTTIAPHWPFRWYATNVPLPSPSQYMLLSGLPLGCPVLPPPLLSPPPLLPPSPLGLNQLIQAGVRDAGRGLQLVVELVHQGALDREVGDHADRGAAEGEQRDQAGDQPAAEAAGWPPARAPSRPGDACLH